MDLKSTIRMVRHLANSETTLHSWKGIQKGERLVQAFTVLGVLRQEELNP